MKIRLGYRARSDPALQKALVRYKRAVEDKANEGSIPIVGQDREEQEAIDAAHKLINAELGMAYRSLMSLIERRVVNGGPTTDQSKSSKRPVDILAGVAQSYLDINSDDGILEEAEKSRISTAIKAVQ